MGVQDIAVVFSSVGSEYNDYYGYRPCTYGYDCEFTGTASTRRSRSSTCTTARIRSGCGVWWSESSSTVKRSVFLDDYAVSVALDVLKFAAVSDLGHPVSEVPLDEP